MARAANAQPLYNKDEKALCFHGELLYEAKVLDYKLKDSKDSNEKKDVYQYLVHYKGWKSTWDDWVLQERLRKFTEENKELAMNLRKEMESLRPRLIPNGARANPPQAKNLPRRPHGSDLTASSNRGSEDRSSAAPQPPRGSKRARDIEGIDKEEEFLRRPAVRLFIPDALKSILVDDWEKVTKEQKLVQIPSPTPITKFLNEYYAAEASSRRPGSSDADILEEVIAGIKEYFNKSLGRILLYRLERPQFHEVHKQIETGHGEHAGSTFCDMYGCEHLLRLFVSMPDLIAHTNMDAQAISRLREELTKMTQWLAKRITIYLASEYQHAGQEYLDSTKS